MLASLLAALTGAARSTHPGHPAPPEFQAPVQGLCRRQFTLLPLALATSACTPQIIPAGMPVTDPAVSPRAFIMADGARLPYRAWLPPGEPRVVLLGLHGFGDYSVNAFDIPAPLFTAAGIAVYAYDQRGFGAAPHRGIWPGAPTLVSDAIAVTRLVRARHPGIPLYLMGESMGVAVLLVAATSANPPPADGYVLLAPAVRGRASMAPWMRMVLEFASRAIPLVGFRASAPGFAPTDSEEAMERWARDPLTAKEVRVDAVYGLVDLMDEAVAAVPRFRARTLILYGGHDALVPEEAMQKMLQTLPAGAPHRFAFYPKGYHLLLRDRNRAVVTRDIAAWVLDPDGPLPSGADEAGKRWLASLNARATG
ncbi:MAG: alpha/beta hydrolase [Acetobacteraceae bacterium]|nr:alpha/beta hydrolase [Acetobacteraceae bacterium]